MNALARRAFSSRSAIRAPPAPSSAVPMAAAPRTARAGRVAMLPTKASEPAAAPASVSHVSTSAPLAHDVFPQPGTVSTALEHANVLRVGESS
ncbi:conserved hypothetical protein [Sporisorium reilianum SRZ2]|uniref:Uncharacterized protein n=2 Tax=Sporisorium reilianum TaxID=72558 RepID=E6ZT98_SPORE|nr:conserved hypothetical protein [Sporisorium reilianum SRZ2]SJX61130.1 uncharacterized protein SRS1_12360 [Sporisorium reilianum f. sp. reilianum]